jgi:hypothetical protein
MAAEMRFLRSTEKKKPRGTEYKTKTKKDTDNTMESNIKTE